MKKIIYFDNNATTKTCNESTKIMTQWIQSCSNPSGSNYLANASKTLIEKGNALIDDINSLKKQYYIVFTSGASESNCTLIHMVVDAWARNVKTIPHIISSSLEHKSILECLMCLHEDGKIELTLINPNIYGVIDPTAVEESIQKNTALITIMFANNEIGSINPIKRIGEIAHKNNIPFHTDAVQVYGKVKINIPDFNIDALSMSFHKLYGPQGVGLLIIKKKFVEGYGLKGTIAGTQQFGLRGGTENIPGIAGAVSALVKNFEKRQEKNKQLAILREFLIEKLSKKIRLDEYKDVLEGKKSTGKAICILGPKDTKSVLPSTVLLSILDYDKDFCNVKFKKLLEDNNVIVSIGSACNTKSAKASHVLDAIKAPPIIKRGVLRISFGDENTLAELKTFINIFLKCIKES